MSGSRARSKGRASRSFARWIGAGCLLSNLSVSGIALASSDTPTLPRCLAGDGIPPALDATALTIFGETHGTQEAPAFVAAFVCRKAVDGRPVVLALEIPSMEQPSIDRYFASSGSIIHRQALLAGPFWHRNSQDGRSSLAILTLIERMRAMRADGVSVSIVAMDEWDAGTTRDALMAARLRESMTARPGSSHVVLVGNVHAAKRRGTSWDASYESLAYLLRDLDPRSFDFRSDGDDLGTAWVCAGGVCGARSWLTNDRLSRSVGIVLDAREGPAFDGTHYVGKITASPPAVSMPVPLP